MARLEVRSAPAALSRGSRRCTGTRRRRSVNPKGAIVSHANCFWTNLALSRTAELTSADVVLAVMPRVIDRIKDIYISGGESIAPAGIEKRAVRPPGRG
jgi:long-subunit acyl-CoA synthetase (AMP-forming)